MKTDNRSRGGRFEQEMAEKLAEHGFWCHVMQQNKAGQPADLIAVKGRYHTLIDCKVVSEKKGFPFEHIEENQRLAMQKFYKIAWEGCYFALRLTDGSVWLLGFGKILRMMEQGKTRLTSEEIRTKTWTLNDWLRAADDWSKE